MAEKNRIGMLVSARLISLIEAEFVSSDKDDDEFAVYASEKLGQPITKWMVRERRQELEIPSKAERTKSPLNLLSERIEALERQSAADHKEMQGLAAIAIETKSRLEALEKAVRLGEHFWGAK